VLFQYAQKLAAVHGSARRLVNTPTVATAQSLLIITHSFPPKFLIFIICYKSVFFLYKFLSDINRRWRGKMAYLLVSRLAKLEKWPVAFMANFTGETSDFLLDVECSNDFYNILLRVVILSSVEKPKSLFFIQGLHWKASNVRCYRE
jgi:hypothetical protein